MVAQTLGFILLVAVVLFGAAGRIDIPMFWLYLGGSSRQYPQPAFF